MGDDLHPAEIVPSIRALQAENAKLKGFLKQHFPDEYKETFEPTPPPVPVQAALPEISDAQLLARIQALLPQLQTTPTPQDDLGLNRG